MSMKKYQHQVRNIQTKSLELILASRKMQEILLQFQLPVSFEERISQAKENLNFIYLTPGQRKIADEITKEVAGMIPLSDFVIRGFLWRAIRQWQQTHKQPIALVSKMNRIAQFGVGIEILNSVRHFLSRAIYIPDKKLKRQYLDEIICKTSEYYEELLSVQAFLNNPDNEEILLDYEIETWLEENAALFPIEK
ncbi:MAG: hypothetical protein ACFFDT_15780 [Candidatus Hodarchaeota archaeon]